jgi:cellulose biosynthesis protein BcsQ
MKIITCFSYKGGAARTTAASNIAAALASVNAVGSIDVPLRRKVALLDLDVFSAGTHRVFEITNEQISEFSQSNRCIQDYLCQQMAPSDYATNHGITLDHPLMQRFLRMRGAMNNCDKGFTLFPARPDPETKFAVQKLHENLLLELLIELENKTPAFDYAILDGENGTRQMADIALRLADIILVFFRLTWQHIEGTLNTVRKWQENPKFKPVYLIPTCVPLITDEDKVYQPDAPGLQALKLLTRSVPDISGLDEYSRDHWKDAGHFWADVTGAANRLCIHESLCLKGEERIIVFDGAAQNDQAAKDLYRIAAEIDQICHQSSPSE